MNCATQIIRCMCKIISMSPSFLSYFTLYSLGWLCSPPRLIPICAELARPVKDLNNMALVFIEFSFCLLHIKWYCRWCINATLPVATDADPPKLDFALEDLYSLDDQVGYITNIAQPHTRRKRWRRLENQTENTAMSGNGKWFSAAVLCLYWPVNTPPILNSIIVTF